MSAKGRGPTARKNGHYATPAWLTRALLKHLGPSNVPRSVIDLGSGAGAIMAEVCRYWSGRSLVGIELRQRLHDRAVGVVRSWPGRENWGGITCFRGDVLDRGMLRGMNFAHAIFNPPFELALEFAQRAQEIADTVCMLQRVNWLEANPRSIYAHVVRRNHWLEGNPPEVRWSHLRPSFTRNGKCDATAYAWLIWGREAKPGTCGSLALDPDAWDDKQRKATP